MRFSSAALFLGLVAGVVGVDVLAPVDSAYLCPRNPFQLLGSSLKVHNTAQGPSGNGTKAKVKPGRRVVVAEQDWKYEDFEEEEEEETNFKGNLWEVRTSIGKGLGLFARRKIKRGTRILVESPLFTVRPPPTGSDKVYGVQQLFADVQRAFKRLSPKEKGAYLSCFDNRASDDQETSREVLIFRNNAAPLPDGSFAVFPKIAKINHSCNPNAVSMFSEPQDARIIWAGRDIKKGEEITITYVPLLQTTEKRREGLAKYGFHCECEVCRAGTESDKKRVEIDGRIAQLEGQLVRKKKPRRDILERAEKLVEMLEEEGLADYLGKAYHLAAFAAVRKDNIEAARHWGERELALHEFADENSQFSRAARQFLDGLPATD